MARIAVIDLGTNTFHLLIAEVLADEVNTLYKEKIAVKIGQNGISKGLIATDAIKRAVQTLKIFKTVIDQFHVTQVNGVATSAIRNAKNGQSLLNKIEEETGISIQVISGEKEAALIFEGVKTTKQLPDGTQLVMDIGGGSVEFILGDANGIKWCKSFEIGAQRLLDLYHQTDPIEQSSINLMNDWLNEQLADLVIAIKTHNPIGLIGCSGTFDTLKSIYTHEQKIEASKESQIFSIPVTAYQEIHEELISKNKSQRLDIPGMVTMRVDMIVVASCLIHFVLNQLQLKEITACSVALKEGLLAESIDNNSDIN
jgi:exopolyphosphatase / guanosine-5'-triphosphate,3'-diphosphate pyrophosphatase